MRKFFKSTDIFSVYWWTLLALTAALVAITVNMGLWQLDRAQQREAIEAGQQDSARMPALTDKDFQAPLSDGAGLNRMVDLSGRWLDEWTVYLDNRTMHGLAGFWVLTPLRLPNGAVVWVQRGWAPRDAASATALPRIDTPRGLVRVQGRWIVPPSKLMEFQSAAQPDGSGFARIRQNVDQDSFEKQTGLEFAATVQQTGPASEGLLRDWPTLIPLAAKNRAYAWQWFAISAVIAALFLWFQLIRKIWHVKA